MILTEQQLNTLPVFGIAGNFAEHLAQAGEASDFVNVHTGDENAPKGMFPIYIPQQPGYLGVYPLSSNKITADFKTALKVQVEPEISVLFNVEYDESNQVAALTACAFSAFNDCSNRRTDVAKISQKKNWGVFSAGVSEQWITIDKFEAGGVLDHYHLCCYLKRDGEVLDYGVDSPATGYNYFYQQLNQWIITTLNQQTDFGPLENLAPFLAQAGYPNQIVVALGATRYTAFGETGYVKPGDQIGVFVYDARQTTKADVEARFARNDTFADFSGSALVQQVVAG